MTIQATLLNVFQTKQFLVLRFSVIANQLRAFINFSIREDKEIYLWSDSRTRTVLPDCIVPCFSKNLIRDTYVGFSWSAETLKPLYPQHFCGLWGGPALFGWLQTGLRNVSKR